MKKNDVKVGFFLAKRYIRGTNPWTTVLITFVMTLTFLNLTVIGGLLEGIVVGSFEGLRDKALGDVYISPKEKETFINRSQEIISELNSDARVSSFSPRLRTRVEIITEDEIFNVLNASEKRSSVNTSALGIYPEKETATTNLPNSIIEGNYFSENSSRREVILGSALLARYSPFGEDVLSDVYPGDFVYIRIGDSKTLDEQSVLEESGNPSIIQQPEAESNSEDVLLQKYLVRGVHKVKSGELDFFAFMNFNEVKGYISNPANDVSAIAVRLTDDGYSESVKSDLIEDGYDDYAQINTLEEEIGSFLDDIRVVFQLFGVVIGSIGIIVSSITIFIIIFVTAVARKKFIGILKAIGVTPNAVRISYVLYAMFFALVGITIGMIILNLLLVPFFIRNPIPFPFSDGILYATAARNMLYIGLLCLATLIAGFIPAHRVVKKPVLDSLRSK